MLDLKVYEIGADLALDMVRKYHYSDTLPRVNKHFLGFVLGGALVGVMTLGYGTRPRHTIQKLFPELDTGDYLEIGRMCMTDEMPRNSESQMISRCVRWLKKNAPQTKVLFTWADGMMGKPGYVYQACSFSYVGFIETDMYLKDGVKLHPRKMRNFLADSDDDRLTVRPSLAQMRELGIEHFRGRQFKYFKLLGAKAERKRLMKMLAVDTQPYPKQDQLRWQRQDLSSGEWVEVGAPFTSTDYSKAAFRQESLF